MNGRPSPGDWVSFRFGALLSRDLGSYLDFLVSSHIPAYVVAELHIHLSCYTPIPALNLLVYF